jgi:hypothetical protein
LNLAYKQKNIWNNDLVQFTHNFRRFSEANKWADLATEAQLLLVGRSVLAEAVPDESLPTAGLC